MKLILASASPRRRELLERVGLTDFTVLPADVDETIPSGLAPNRAVMALSARKAQWAAASHPGALIIAADTVVSIDEAILGKPKNADDARAILHRLSGQSHRVYTGLTLQQGSQTLTECECTQVHFRPLREEEIDAYLASGEPMDKAGAYGVQGLGALFVSSIEGDYYNVMGLPLCRLGRLLEEFGVTLLPNTEKVG